MVEKILTEAGFIRDETYAENQFNSPPRTTYAVFHDSFTRRGADGLNLIKDHSYTIELYSEWPDPDAEAKIEEILDKYGIEFDKEPRHWIQAEQIYQVVYMFDFIEK